MLKIFSIAAILLLACTLWSCKKGSSTSPPIDNDKPFPDILTASDALDALYKVQVDFCSLDGNESTPGWKSMADFSESFPSENANVDIVQRTGWPYNSWALDWVKSYAYIKQLNLFMLKDSLSTGLTETDRKRFFSEARFLRANFYFELVKRMGGVPLVLNDDFTNDRKDLKVARAKESEVYDFIINEGEAIKNDLSSDMSNKSHASKGAALAMKSRAALYAGSIAKYGILTPEVSLAGGEVGIAASKASAYYSLSLGAAQEIIGGQAGGYTLYNLLINPSDNFANLFLDRNSLETIYMEDFIGDGESHAFTVDNQPYSLTEETNDGGRLNPSLNLAESFEKLDNTYAPLAATSLSGDPIYYDHVEDIFSGRDARFAGTLLIPGGKYRSGTVDIWAGYQLPDGSITTSASADQLKPIVPGGPEVQVVGKDGPINGLEFRTQTGFYLRKYLDNTIGSGKKNVGSRVPFIRYRYGEVLLNAAEAAFELGQTNVAANNINAVRARAGLSSPLTAGDITFNRIVHERRVELAFEGHLLFDMKRWRLATSVWNGMPTSLPDLKSNLGVASKPSTQPWGLWPYKNYNPGSFLDGKWVFKETLPSQATGYNKFLPGNYYSSIPADVILANPLIVQQPNQ
ncbi:MAG: RagB/SusD family nutrient uptake outer membrane protein [Flavitalea sp.]